MDAAVTYEGDNQEHFEKPDDGGCKWAVRGTVYRSWRRHRYRLVSHHACGFHMERVGPCCGECGPIYANKDSCKTFICISEHAIGRTFHEEY